MGREDFVGEGEGVDMVEVGGEEGGKGRRRRSEGGLGNEETEHVRGCFFSGERCGYMRCTRSSPSPSDSHSYYRRRARGSRLEGSCSSLPPFPFLSFFFSLLLQHPTTLSLSYLFLFSTIFSVPPPPTNIPTPPSLHLFSPSLSPMAKDRSTKPSSSIALPRPPKEKTHLPGCISFLTSCKFKERVDPLRESASDWRRGRRKREGGS